MEKNNQFPTLPSNYVTLSQLQERWLKEKQQRDLKEKEKEKEKGKEREAENQQLPQPKAQNDGAKPVEASKHRRSDDRKYRARNRKIEGNSAGAQPNIDAAKPVEASKYRRSDDQKYRGRNRKIEGSSAGASSKVDSVGEAAVVEGIKSENTGNERKSNGSRDDRINQTRMEKKKKKRNRKNKKQEQKEKIAKDGETETQLEKAVEREAQEPPAVSEKMSKTAKVGETETQHQKAVVREKPEPPATIEKIGVPVKIYAIKRDLRSKNVGLVEKSVNTVETEGEVKNVTEKSKDTIEIEKSIGDLSLNEESDRSEAQNNTYNRRNVEYRTRSRIVDSSYSKHRVRTVKGRDSEYRGFNGGFSRRSDGFRNGGYRDNGSYRGSDRSWKDRGSRNEKVWVKKEVAVGTDDD